MVIIQAVGAIEQHSPHLLLIVDAAIGVGVLGKAGCQFYSKLKYNTLDARQHLDLLM